VSVRAPEDAEEQQEDVEDVEEDPCGERDRLFAAGSAQAVEVDDRIQAEDREAGGAQIV
jgi:hypothetical protein